MTFPNGNIESHNKKLLFKPKENRIRGGLRTRQLAEYMGVRVFRRTMSKAVFFDLDNTLVHRNKSILAYSERFFERYSEELVDVSPVEISNIIFSQDNGGYLPAGSSYKSIKDAVSHELHKEIIHSSKVSVEDIRDHWIHCFPKCAIPMNGANETLTHLAQEGYHLGIISNGADGSRMATAKSLSAYHYINQLVSSEAAGISKPNSKIFTHSVFDAGFIPEQCWYVGDHPINDIVGARKAGMQTIWLKGFHSWPNNIEAPAHSVESLAEVKSVIESNSNNQRQARQKYARLP
ncbi:MAG: putative hydrolase of the HAD superfamily [Reinekea sp.]|jgi:putative hydrolase of the HAD superfamily